MTTSAKEGAETPVHGEESSSRVAFVTTRWTVVRAAARNDTTRAQQALNELCQVYWYPLYAYLRRCGHSPAEAEDFTQDFFGQLISKSFLLAADREKGRFRSFLLIALKRFLANQQDRARALKRGGGRPILSLDVTNAEGQYLREPADTLTPDKLFDRRWALTLVDRTMARLRAEFEKEGKTEQFEMLKGFLVPEPSENRYAGIAGSTGQSEGALRIAAHRLRKRFRELFKDEIAQTVDDPGEIEPEVRQLMAALTD